MDHIFCTPACLTSGSIAVHPDIVREQFQEQIAAYLILLRYRPEVAPRGTRALDIVSEEAELSDPHFAYTTEVEQFIHVVDDLVHPHSRIEIVPKGRIEIYDSVTMQS